VPQTVNQAVNHVLHVSGLPVIHIVSNIGSDEEFYGESFVKTVTYACLGDSVLSTYYDSLLNVIYVFISPSGQ
jgi:hypothetical protein